MGNSQSDLGIQNGGSISINKDDDLVVQNNIDKFIQKCVINDCNKYIENQKEFNNMDNELKNSIFRYIHTNQLNEIKMKCKLGTECSREDTINYYSEKIKLIIKIRYLLERLVNLTTPDTSKEECDKTNLCVDKINKLNNLLKKLYFEDQKTVYDNGKSIKKRVVIDVPTELNEINTIKNEIKLLIDDGIKENKSIFRQFKNII
jgi:hypothetical protein